MSDNPEAAAHQKQGGISQDLSASGLEIEHLQILGLIGEGGMSSVYRARQVMLDREVAVKIMNGFDEQSLRRFQSEAKITAEFDHPNIIKTLGYGVAGDGRPYLVMELMHGVSLDNEMKTNPRMSLRRFREIFFSVLSALEYAHEKGLVHRDIKPSNIMICKEQGASGSNETVKLLDFGIAKYGGSGQDKQQQLTRTGVVVGSPRYMSPEQCKLEAVDGRSDLYSLSCVMYEALSGESPFESDSALEIMHKHMSAEPPTASELCKKRQIPRQLAELIVSGLAKDAGKRPASASAFREGLARHLDNVDLDRAERAGFRHGVAICAVIAISSCLLLFFFLYAKNQEEQVKESRRIRSCVAGERLFKDLLKAPKARTVDEFARDYEKAKRAAVILEANSKDKNEVAASLYMAAKLGYLYWEGKLSPPPDEVNALLSMLDKSMILRGDKKNIAYIECIRLKAEVLKLAGQVEAAADCAMQTMPLYALLPHASEARLSRRIYVLPLLAGAKRAPLLEKMARDLLAFAPEEEPYDHTAVLECKSWLALAQCQNKKREAARLTAESVADELRANGEIDAHARRSVLEVLSNVYQALGDTERFWEIKRQDELAQKQAYARGRPDKQKLQVLQIFSREDSLK